MAGPMFLYTIRQIKLPEYETIRQLDREAFVYNIHGGEADYHEIFADKVRRSPYFIPELDLAAEKDDGLIIGHGIFSRLPMGDTGTRAVILNSLAVRHGENDSRRENFFEFQRKGVGQAIIRAGFEIAKSLGFTACVVSGNPDVYHGRLGFRHYYELGLVLDSSVKEAGSTIFASELGPDGFAGTNKILGFPGYDFL
ncbi:MAG: N-acetyltransferase [Treponema sp.]|nr:N-acetyltransferase [Treponema sp.]